MISKDVLYDYADGLLDMATTKVVENALLKDELLQSQLADILLFKQLLRSDTLVAPNTEFSKNLLSAWADEQATTSAVATPSFQANYRPLQIVSVLFFLLCTVLYCLVLSTSSSISPSLTIPTWVLGISWDYTPLYWSMLLCISITGVLFIERIMLFWVWKKQSVSIH
jgi:hypothetical protein